MSKSNSWSNKILELSVGKTAISIPTVWVALYTTDPTFADTGTEITGGAYARVATSGATWTSASGRSLNNASAITFPTATGVWGNLAFFGLRDAATSGTLIRWGPLDVIKPVGIGDTPAFGAGTLVCTEA